MEVIGSIKYKLDDHYEHLMGICRRTGVLIDKTNSDTLKE